MRLERWIVDTLCKFGNVSLPPLLVKRYGIKSLENELRMLTGDYTICIRVSTGQVMTEVDNETHKRHETFYIAETEERRKKNGIQRS